MPEAIRAYTENPWIDDRFFTLVTDDMSPSTLCNEGQLLRVVRTAIRQGVPPVKAIQYVTINAAQSSKRHAGSDQSKTPAAGEGDLA